MGDYGSDFTKALQTQLRQLIHYAKGADATLQREVAEKLANEAVKPGRQEQIVELGEIKGMVFIVGLKMTFTINLLKVIITQIDLTGRIQLKRLLMQTMTGNYQLINLESGLKNLCK